jgi:hypothetical protein
MENPRVFIMDNLKAIIVIINFFWFLVGFRIAAINLKNSNQKISIYAIAIVVFTTFKQTKIYLVLLGEFTIKFLLFYVISYGDIKITLLNSMPIFGFFYSTSNYFTSI